MKVVSFGEILFDIIECQYYLGGVPLNFAAHLTKCGAEVSIFSSVGADELGKQAIGQIKGLGIGTRFIQVDNNYPTGDSRSRLLNRAL